ncbi:MAG: hypothetical protein SXV54_28025 [Chloroflexota bacterium]|nr:hypothetical protein [Chloroflexota bacterium]
MHSDNWTDKTIPTPRVEPDGDEAGPAATPAIVWVLGSVVALLALAVCGLWALYLLRGQVANRGPTPTPIIWTPTVAPTPIVSPTPPPTDDPTPTISPDIAIGRYVQVVDTGGYGLSLRSGPGENYTRMDVALEGEVFVIVDGPTVSGDSEWWKIQDWQNVEREWWAVGNFLEPVEHP